MTIIKIVTAISQEKTNMSSESESETFTVNFHCISDIILAIYKSIRE